MAMKNRDKHPLRLREQLVRRGWLRDESEPFIRRLSFPPRDAERIDMDLGESKVRIRDQVIADLLERRAHPVSVPCPLGGRSDILLAESDRYGIPIRTVISEQTGLLRTDPYYDPVYLESFYRGHYRSLYTLPVRGVGDHLSLKVSQGEEIWRQVSDEIPQRARVLDIGCSMGGCLIPFKMRGHQVQGCDYGEEFIGYGQRLGLNVVNGGPECVFSQAPFDLIIMRHVLEHIVSPMKLLATVREMLQPDGVLYVEVPGVLSIHRDYQGDVLSYLQNMHVWHFTSSTLSEVLSRTGFGIIIIDEKICCLASPNADRVERCLDGECYRVLKYIQTTERDVVGPENPSLLIDVIGKLRRSGEHILRRDAGASHEG